jgi:hypothetical protein
MVTTVEYQRRREALAAHGYAWNYQDIWQPKITLYRHAPALDAEGNEAFPVGTVLKGLPGNPDYAERKAGQGLLPYPPNESCTCRWCAESRIEVKVQGHADRLKEAVKNVVSSTSEDNEPFVTAECPDCSFKATAPTGTGASSRLRAHSKIHS